MMKELSPVRLAAYRRASKAHAAEVERTRDVLKQARVIVDLVENSRAVTAFAKTEAMARLTGIPLQDLHQANVWNCDKSPSKTCVYDQGKDPSRDSCVFCDEPLERK